MVARRRAALFEEVSARDKGFHVEVRISLVVDQILEAARATSVEVIVTGVARYDQLGDYVLGTTVDRLVWTSPVPTPVVKGGARRPYRKRLAPTDYSDCSALALEVLPACTAGMLLEALPCDVLLIPAPPEPLPNR